MPPSPDIPKKVVEAHAILRDFSAEPFSWLCLFIFKSLLKTVLNIIFPRFILECCLLFFALSLYTYACKYHAEKTYGFIHSQLLAGITCYVFAAPQSCDGEYSNHVHCTVWWVTVPTRPSRVTTVRRTEALSSSRTGCSGERHVSWPLASLLPTRTA